jgi:hypothetical protein
MEFVKTISLHYFVAMSSSFHTRKRKLLPDEIHSTGSKKKTGLTSCSSPSDNAKIANWWRQMPKLFNDKSTSDFTIIVAGKAHIPVHKVVLSLHSEVFRELFEINSTELTITRHSLRATMSFIYMLYDPTESHLVWPMEVFELAKEYQVGAAVQTALKNLHREVSAMVDRDSFFAMVKFAERHCQHDLKMKAFKWLSQQSDPSSPPHGLSSSLGLKLCDELIRFLLTGMKPHSGRELLSGGEQGSASEDESNAVDFSDDGGGTGMNDEDDDDHQQFDEVYEVEGEYWREEEDEEEGGYGEH